MTGAAGFIGSHAVDKLIQRGSLVTAVISKSTMSKNATQNLRSNMKKILIRKANLLDIKDCLRITKSQQIVLNFAAMDGGIYFKIKHPGKIFYTNTLISLNMLEASVLNKVERFLIPSSIEVYSTSSPRRLDEKYGFRDGLNEKIDGYSWSKRLSEVAAKLYHKEYGMKIAIARFGNVYGPRDYVNEEKGRVIPTFINRSLSGKDITIVGDGNQERSFLYVADLIEGVLNLIEEYSECDAVNIVSSRYIRIKDLAKLIITLVGNRGNIVLEKKGINLRKKREISNDKAKKVIDFKEKYSIETGLQKTIEYFKKYN